MLIQIHAKSFTDPDPSEMLNANLDPDLEKTLMRIPIRIHNPCWYPWGSTINSLIICGRSPVFHAMVQHNMIERKTGVVKITDLDVRTVRDMLR